MGSENPKEMWFPPPIISRHHPRKLKHKKLRREEWLAGMGEKVESRKMVVRKGKNV